MNIEEFQNEIQKAEEYLQQRQSLSSTTSDIYLSNVRRLHILEQFGRNPVTILSSTKRNETPNIDLIKDKENNINVENTGINRYSDPDTRNKLIDRLLTEHKMKKQSINIEASSESGSGSGTIKDNVELQQDQLIFHVTPDVNPNLLITNQIQTSPKKDNKKSSPAKLRPNNIVKLNLRIDEMQKEHEINMQKREKLKREFEKQQKEQCTFSPSLPKSTIQIIETVSQRQNKDEPSQSSFNQSQGPVHTKLYSDAQLRAQRNRLLQNSVMNEKMENCTFQPDTHISKRSVSVTRRRGSSQSPSVFHQDDDKHKQQTLPIHERVSELQKERLIKMRVLTKEVEDEQNKSTSFTPHINKISRRLAEKRYSISSAAPGSGTGSGTNSVFSSRGGSAHVSRDNSAHRRSITEKDQETPSAGMITAVTAETLRRANDSLHLDVTSRLQLEGKLSELKMQQLQQELDRQESAKFTPVALSKGTRELAKSNPMIR